MKTIIIMTSQADRLIKAMNQTNKLGKWKSTPNYIAYSYPDEEQISVLEIITMVIYDFLHLEILMRFAKTYLSRRSDLIMEYKKEIFEIFMKGNYLKNEEGFSMISYHLLYTPLCDFLKSNDRINLDGWMIFRVHKYKVILEDIMLQTIYDYETGLNYIDFMKYFKNFKQTQPAVVDILHVYCKKDKEIVLLDEKHEDKTKHYLAKYCDGVDFVYAKVEDQIMHILMHLCPTEIVLHRNKNYSNKNFIITLQKIFEESLTLCCGCETCNP